MLTNVLLYFFYSVFFDLSRNSNNIKSMNNVKNISKQINIRQIRQILEANIYSQWRHLLRHNYELGYKLYRMCYKHHIMRSTSVRQNIIRK